MSRQFAYGRFSQLCVLVPGRVMVGTLSKVHMRLNSGSPVACRPSGAAPTALGASYASQAFIHCAKSLRAEAAAI